MSVFIHAPGSDSPHAGKVEVQGYLKIDRRQSILLVEATREAWLPKSKITIVEQRDDGRATVVMPRWLAEAEGYVRKAVAAPLRARNKFKRKRRY